MFCNISRLCCGKFLCRAELEHIFLVVLRASTLSSIYNIPRWVAGTCSAIAVLEALALGTLSTMHWLDSTVHAQQEQ